jgi:hypothetical protein
MDDEQWLRLIRAFGGAKVFHVASELAADILDALRLADAGHEIVLPALRDLLVNEPVSMRGPLRDSIDSFVSQRQLSGRPVQIYVSGPMFAPMTQVGVKGASSSNLTQSAGAVPIRRPTVDEANSAKRWVEGQKRLAFYRRSFYFSHSISLFQSISFPSGLDWIAGGSSVAEGEIREYTRNLESLDMVLANIEKYIHIAFAALRKDVVVRRMFAMVS